MIEILQTILLIILVDRQLILRNRFKFGIDTSKPNKYGRGHLSIWLLCKKPQAEYYTRDGGKVLFHFRYGKQKAA